MTRFRPSVSDTRDSQIDRALHELLAPAAPPRFRLGFERRLARAVASDEENRRRSRKLRRVLWAYWIGAALVSSAILWHLQDRLASGPGLWVSVTGLMTLAGASLLLSILAALPLGLGHRTRSPRG